MKHNSMATHYRNPIPQNFWGRFLGNMKNHITDSYTIAKIHGRNIGSNLDITNESLIMVSNIMHEDEVIEKLTDLYNQYKETQPALVAIASPFTEDTMPNPIPLTTAMLISSFLKGKAKKEGILKPHGFAYKRIIQHNKQYKKTGEDFFRRAIAYSSFRECSESVLDEHQEVIIVDDHISVGGTIADAYCYLQNTGLNPIGCISTTGSEEGVNIAISPDTFKQACEAFNVKRRSLLRNNVRESERQKLNKDALDGVIRKIFNIKEYNSKEHSLKLLTNKEVLGLTNLFNNFRQKSGIKKESNYSSGH